MALVTNTVDSDSVLLAESHDTSGTFDLGSQVLEVVVVVVQLGGRIGGSGNAEGHGDVCFTDGAEEDVVAVCAVLVESFKDVSIVTGFTISQDI